MSYDLLLIERGSGGDLVINSKFTDLVTVTGFQNAVYLALFGGNVGQSTKRYLNGEQRLDWWANSTIFNQSPNAQMNSLTERTLREVVLNSQGRLIIEQAVKSDLKFMQDFSEVEASVYLELNDRIRIEVKLTKPNVEQENEITFVWDRTLNELQTNNQYTTV